MGNYPYSIVASVIVSTWHSTKNIKPDLTELKQYQFPKESTTELEQEYIKLMSEEAVIQYSSDPESLKHIIENADYCPEVGEVDKIDIILESIKI